MKESKTCQACASVAEHLSSWSKMLYLYSISGTVGIKKKASDTKWSILAHQVIITLSRRINPGHMES